MYTILNEDACSLQVASSRALGKQLDRIAFKTVLQWTRVGYAGERLDITPCFKR